MIKKLTNHILSYLISSNAIDDNEETKDYYRYGIEITISSLINIAFVNKKLSHLANKKVSQL